MLAKNHHRKLLATVAMVVLVFTAGSGDVAFAAEKVTLKIANSQWLDALRGKNLWTAVTKYQEVNPDVTLEQEAIPAAEFNDKLTTEMGAGQGPDIAIMQEGLFYAIAEAEFLVDISAATEGVTLNNTNKNGEVGGERLGLGWQRAAYALIYNKPVVDAAGATVPTSIDELIISAKSAARATPGIIGFTARHQINDLFGWSLDFMNWIYGYGGNFVDGNGKLKVDTPEIETAVAAFKKTYDAGIIPIGDSMATQRTRFKENHAAFSIDNSGGTLNIASGGAVASTNLHSAPMPFKNPGIHQQIFLGVSKHSKHQKEAIAFLAWLVSPQGQQLLRDASGPDALATDVPVSDAYLKANPWAKSFIDLAPSSRSAVIPGYEVETTQIMRFVMQAVEKVILTDADPKAALAEAQTAIDQQF